MDNQGTLAAINQDLDYTGPFTLTADAAGNFEVRDGRSIDLNGGTTTVLGSGTTFTATGTGRFDVRGNLMLASDFTLPSAGPAFDISTTDVTTVGGTGAFINADTVYTRRDVFDAPFTNQGEAKPASSSRSWKACTDSVVGSRMLTTFGSNQACGTSHRPARPVATAVQRTARG